MIPRLCSFLFYNILVRQYIIRLNYFHVDWLKNSLFLFFINIHQKPYSTARGEDPCRLLGGTAECVDSEAEDFDPPPRPSLASADASPWYNRLPHTWTAATRPRSGCGSGCGRRCCSRCVRRFSSNIINTSAESVKYRLASSNLTLSPPSRRYCGQLHRASRI